MIQLFASDLDGTLLNKDHKSDEVILSKAKELQDMGYTLACSTGRALGMIPKEELPGFYYVCMNGAAVLSPDQKIVYGSPIDPEIIREMVERFPDMPLEYNAIDRLYTTVSKERCEAINIEHRKEGSGLIPIKSIEDFMKIRKCGVSLEEILAQPIYKVNCLYPNDEIQKEFDLWLQKNSHRLVNAQSRPDLYEITAHGVNKAAGVHHLAEVLGLEDENVAVFGDGGNDLDMLRAFENSYAPSTGCQAAKETARHVIGPYDEYSVINKMAEIAKEQGPLC